MIRRFGDGRDWFFEKRFGLFLHWGPYAACGKHEQYQWRFDVSRGEYERIAAQFNPAQFDPDRWLDEAEAAGMGYVCFTTKHVDGFCMWDTAVHDYKITRSAYGRDVLAELADACHRRSMPLCLYYSVADMHNRHYPQRGRNYELAAPQPDDEPSFDRYVQDMRAQIHELLTSYGEIHGVWWDANVAGWGHPEFNDWIRSLQPKAVINGRGPDSGDFDTPERDFASGPHGSDFTGVLSFEKPTEACQSVGRESWGYRLEEDYYTSKYLMQSIDRIMARGGNYLLNVGPTADGVFAEPDLRILSEIGGWYHSVGEAFLGAEPASHLTDNRDVLLTRKGKSLYVHFPVDPSYTAVVLNPLSVLPQRVTVLNTGEELEARLDVLPRFFRHESPYLRIPNLPLEVCREEVMVLKLELDEMPNAD